MGAAVVRAYATDGRRLPDLRTLGGRPESRKARCSAEETNVRDSPSAVDSLVATVPVIGDGYWAMPAFVDRC